MIRSADGGRLVSVLAASKPGGWILDVRSDGDRAPRLLAGMTRSARLLVLHPDPTATIPDDERVEVDHTPYRDWLRAYRGVPFDLICASRIGSRDVTGLVRHLAAGGLLVIATRGAERLIGGRGDLHVVGLSDDLAIGSVVRR